MSVQEISLPAASRGARVPTRALGAAGRVLSPMLLIAALFFYPATPDAAKPHPFYASVCGVLYLAGALATATAMRALRVTGSGRGARVLYAVQAAGLVLAMMFDVLEYAAPQARGSVYFFIADMAYPFSHMLMLVVGAAVVKARVWRGWRLIPAFLVGLALPVFFATAAAFGRMNSFYSFPILVTAGFFLLGLAVATTKQKD